MWTVSYTHLEVAKHLLEDSLTAFADYLPQFQ